MEKTSSPSKRHVIHAAYDLADNWGTKTVRVSTDFLVIQAGDLYIEPLFWQPDLAKIQENESLRFNALAFVAENGRAYPQMSGEYKIVEYGLSGERKLDEYIPLWKLRNANLSLRLSKFMPKIASPNVKSGMVKPGWVAKHGIVVPQESRLYNNVWCFVNECGASLKEYLDSVNFEEISDRNKQLEIFNGGCKVPEGAVPFARAIGDILSGKTMGA